MIEVNPVQANPFAAPVRLRRLQVEITTFCNLTCQGCQRTIGRKRKLWKNAHMAVETFTKILGHAPAADVLVLQGIGEPTMHPDLEELVRRGVASGKVQHITLNTNALAQPIGYYKKLQAAGLSHLSISVDSLDPAIAKITRAGTDTVKLSRRIVDLLKLFGDRITFSVVLSRLNLAHLAVLIEALARLGARNVEIQPLVGYGAASDAHCLDGVELRRAAALVAELRSRLPAVNLMVAAAMTPDGSRCRRPFHSAYVTVDGFLTPCCVTNDVALLGRTNLIGQDFSQAWQAPALAQWYSRYFDHEPEMCRSCGFNARGCQDGASPEMVEARRLRRMGGHAEAEQLLLKALRRPPMLDTLGELGLAVTGKGDGRTGELLLATVAALHDQPDEILALAEALRRQGQADPARKLVQQCLDRHPRHAEAYGVAMKLVSGSDGLPDRLVELLRRAHAAGCTEAFAPLLAALDDCATPSQPLLTLANVLRTSGRADLARPLVQAALRRQPDHLGALMVLCVAQLEIVYASESEIEHCREAFLAQLTRLEAALADADTDALAQGAAQIGQAKPFYLAYQGHNDREPMQRWGAVLARLSQAEPLETVPWDGVEKIRIGFVSAYFRPHSVSKLFGGWMRHLDRARFEIYGYEVRDQTVRRSPLVLHDACDHFQPGPQPLAEWRRMIAADRPHVLIYPEVGMEPSVVRLAATRLAPVQCVSWGHPVTTGFPSMDYVLSSALMEPEDGDDHYSETLVRLPHLSVHYSPLNLPRGRMTRQDLGLADQAVVYICCQSLFKYLPRHDMLFTRIAVEIPASRFVFIAGHDGTTTAKFWNRLSAAFTAANLSVDRHCLLVSPIAHEDFPSFLGLGDVYLDSHGWSGGNTTLEAVANDLPVVASRSPLMRGRHSAAILERMGLGDMVAPDMDAVVRLAVSLGLSPDARQDYRRRMAEGRDFLYEDLEPVRALEDFLTDAVTSACQP